MRGLASFTGSHSLDRALCAGKAFVDYAKANPGEVSFGSAGATTLNQLNHLTRESLKLLTGIPDLIHVPYRGAGPALTDLMGGQIPMIIPAMSGQVVSSHRQGAHSRRGQPKASTRHARTSHGC